MDTAESPKGIITRNTQGTCEKFRKKKSWVWDRLKRDPEFPRPFYISPGVPLWMDHELDAYILKLAERTRKVAT